MTEPVNGGRIPGLRASMLAVRETPAVEVRKNVTLNNSFSPFIVVAFFVVKGYLKLNGDF